MGNKLDRAKVSKTPAEYYRARDRSPQTGHPTPAKPAALDLD
ncbi:hypothetical protein [Desulfallas thermosapovorans]